MHHGSRQGSLVEVLTKLRIRNDVNPKEGRKEGKRMTERTTISAHTSQNSVHI